MGVNPIYATMVAMTTKGRSMDKTRFRLANGSPYIFPSPCRRAVACLSLQFKPLWPHLSWGNFLHEPLPPSQPSNPSSQPGNPPSQPSNPPA